MFKLVFLGCAAVFLLSSCISPPTTNSGSSGPTVSVPIPGGSVSTSPGDSSSSPGSAGGSAGLPGGNSGGLPSPSMPGGLPGIPSAGGTTGSASGSSDGSPSGSPDGSPEGSENGSVGANGDAGIDLPSWEPTAGASDTGAAGEQEGGSSEGSGSEPSFGDADLAELEKTLDEAIGTFDGEILREQENARDKTGNVGSSGGQPRVDVLAGVGEFETFGGGNGNAPGPTSEEDSNQQVFNDVPPPSPDDDIVARQIREAAIKEQDPEQRAILWQEYERYKGEI